MVSVGELSFRLDNRQFIRALREMRRELAALRREARGVQAGLGGGRFGTPGAGVGGATAAGAAGGRFGSRGYGTTAVAAGAASRGGGLRLGGLAGGVVGVAGLRQFVSTAADLEFRLAQLRGVTGATAEQLRDLELAARDAGASTKFTASEAAEGLLELARAGLDLEQQQRALLPTLNLAVAGLMSLGESADLATNVAAQFGLQAREIERIGDALVATANRSNTNVAQLGDGLKVVGIVAAELGLSLEQTTAALGVLANRGLKGSEAATKLRQAFLQMLSPSSAGAAALSDMGLSLADIDIRSQGLSDVLRNLASRQLDVAKAADLVGVRNAAALVALTNSVDEYERLAKEVDAADGAMRELVDFLSKTFNNEVKALTSAISELFLTVNEETNFLESLKSGVRDLTEFTRALAGMGNEFRDLDESGRFFLNTVQAIAQGGQSAFDLISRAAEVTGARLSWVAGFIPRLGGSSVGDWLQYQISKNVYGVDYGGPEQIEKVMQAARTRREIAEARALESGRPVPTAVDTASGTIGARRQRPRSLASIAGVASGGNPVIDALQAERAALQRGARAREIYNAQIQAGDPALNAQIETLVREIQALERLSSLTEGAAQGIVDIGAAWIFSADSAEEATRRILESISQLALQTFALQPLQNVLADLFQGFASGLVSGGTSRQSGGVRSGSINSNRGVNPNFYGGNYV